MKKPKPQLWDDEFQWSPYIVDVPYLQKQFQECSLPLDCKHVAPNALSKIFAYDKEHMTLPEVQWDELPIIYISDKDHSGSISFRDVLTILQLHRQLLMKVANTNVELAQTFISPMAAAQLHNDIFQTGKLTSAMFAEWIIRIAHSVQQSEDMRSELASGLNRFTQIFKKPHTRASRHSKSASVPNAPLIGPEVDAVATSSRHVPHTSRAELHHVPASLASGSSDRSATRSREHRDSHDAGQKGGTRDGDHGHGQYGHSGGVGGAWGYGHQPYSASTASKMTLTQSGQSSSRLTQSRYRVEEDLPGDFKAGGDGEEGNGGAALDEWVGGGRGRRRGGSGYSVDEGQLLGLSTNKQRGFGEVTIKYVHKLLQTQNQTSIPFDTFHAMLRQLSSSQHGALYERDTTAGRGGRDSGASGADVSESALREYLQTMYNQLVKLHKGQVKEHEQRSGAPVPSLVQLEHAVGIRVLESKGQQQCRWSLESLKTAQTL